MAATYSSRGERQPAPRRTSVRRLGLVVLCVLGAALVGTALAQQCTYESEPNDDPAAATRLTDAGPQPFGPDRYNEVSARCLTGEVSGSDKDVYRWEVTELDARHRWTFSLQGPAGGVASTVLFRTDAAGVTTEYERVASQAGSAARSGEFLVEPGTYYLAVSSGGAAGEYVVDLTPVIGLRYGAGEDRYDDGVGRRYTGAFGLFGPVAGELSQTFTIDADGAKRVWGVELWAALGTEPRVELQGAGGVVTQGQVDAGGRVRLPGLQLAAGDYTLRVLGDSGMVRLRLESQGVRGNGVAVEPNDDWGAATAFPLGTEMSATVGGRDFYRIDVSREGAGVYNLAFSADADLTYTLRDEAGNPLLVSRSGQPRTALAFAEGAYQLLVEGPDGTGYRMALTPAAAPAGGEIEPNDYPITASPLPDGGQVRGRLDGSETDVYSLDVVDTAQRFRVQLVGNSIDRLAELTSAGDVLNETRGQQRLRLDDVILLPGRHYFEVRGSAGDYALKVLSLGPVQVGAEQPPTDQPLTPATQGGVGQDAAAAAAALESAVLEAGPPPPPGTLELEPNDDASRATRLVPGAVHVGRLTSESPDYYRFFLADDQYVSIEVVPPTGGSTIDLWFDDLGWVRFPDLERGSAVKLERLFIAGDHTFYLDARNVETDGYYQLRVNLLGRLMPAVDAEPNDDYATASLMPAELEWTGHVGEYGNDYDTYRLPVFSSDTTFEVTASDVTSRLSIDLRNEASTLDFAERGDAQTGAPWRGTLPAGQQAYLRLAGNTTYEIAVTLGNDPDKSQLLPPRASGTVAVSLTSPFDELAAFWHEGQVLEATAHVENRGAEPQELRLEASSSHATVRLDYEPDLRLAPGESRDVPVRVEVPSDMRDDLPLRVEVAVSGTSGSAAASLEAALTCDAAPLAPFGYWPLPTTLLGRMDVLRTNFGAAIHGDTGYERRDLALIDGRVGPSSGGYLSLDHSPTYRLAGDAPVTLLGATLDPRSDGRVGDYLAAFRIETSLDGSSFTTAYEGVLKAAGIEQPFVFDAPVSARYARLVLVSAQDRGTDGYAGEWKLIAADADFGELNLAAPENGGHVVRSEPYVSGYGAQLLKTGDRGAKIDLRDTGTFSFVIGFNDGRAAQVTRLEWQDEAAALAEPQAMFPAVSVEVSLTGGAGPWAPLADWTLERDGTGLAKLAFDAPVWVRYLRVTGQAVEGADGTRGRYYYPPDVVRVLERPASAEYPSVLAEWGSGSRDAVYEYLNPVSATTGVTDSNDDTLQTATPLRSGEQATGTVQVAVDEDWYRLTIPAGQNFLELSLAGDPAIAYRFELVDASGHAVGYDEKADGDARTLSLFADPGDYYLHLWEPKRTVVFSWDTSGSVNPYVAITYNSLASFATDVNGEREAVQLLAFNEPNPTWLLPFWSSDTARVQRSIVEFDRSADSSNAEVALLAATKALADREGTRAIMLMTDAESPGDNLTPELWRAFEEVRPRVFTFEISSGGSDYAQDLMQDWADVNAGKYALAAGVGDFDAGFSRASCLLRRPKQYTVALTTRTQALPGPGSLSVRAAAGAAQPAIEVIFDASGSMGRELPSGEQRITAAKRALTALVNDVLPDGAPFALRAFGHIAPSSCETRLDVPLAPLDRAKALSAVEAIAPKLLSQTPIADSLAAVPQDLAQAGGARTVILITDGAESCGGDPAAAVREARSKGPLDLAIVSLGLEPDALAVFEQLAADVGASYVDVGSYEALAEAVAEALNPAFEVYDAATGALVARGRVGGESVSLEMGVYDVRVLVAPVEEFKAVRVPGEKEVTLTLGAK